VAVDWCAYCGKPLCRECLNICGCDAAFCSECGDADEGLCRECMQLAAQEELEEEP